MKKIVYSTLFFAGMFLTTACSDYLEVGSPSIVDSDFVFSNPTTARAALDGAYEQWRDCAQNKVFGDGLFYAADIAGSDIERHRESYSNQLGAPLSGMSLSKRYICKELWIDFVFEGE